MASSTERGLTWAVPRVSSKFPGKCSQPCCLPSLRASIQGERSLDHFFPTYWGRRKPSSPFSLPSFPVQWMRAPSQLPQTQDNRIQWEREITLSWDYSKFKMVFKNHSINKYSIQTSVRKPLGFTKFGCCVYKNMIQLLWSK